MLKGRRRHQRRKKGSTNAQVESSMLRASNTKTQVKCKERARCAKIVNSRVTSSPSYSEASVSCPHGSGAGGISDLELPGQLSFLLAVEEAVAARHLCFSRVLLLLFFSCFASSCNLSDALFLLTCSSFYTNFPLSFFILNVSSLTSSGSRVLTVHGAACAGLGLVHIGGGAFLRGQLSSSLL